MGYEYTLNVSVTDRNENKAFRIIRINGKETLGDLCDVITFAFGFIHEHSYEYSLEGDMLSSEAIIDSFHLHGGQEIELHYDFGDDWIFRIRVERIYKTPADRPWAIVGGGGFVVQYSPTEGDDEEAEATGEIVSVDSAD